MVCHASTLVAMRPHWSRCAGRLHIAPLKCILGSNSVRRVTCTGIFSPPHPRQPLVLLHHPSRFPRLFSPPRALSPLPSLTNLCSMGMVFWELVVRCIMGRYERPFAEFKNLHFDFQIIIQTAKKGLRPTIPETCPEVCNPSLPLSSSFPASPHLTSPPPFPSAASPFPRFFSPPTTLPPSHILM